MSEEEAKREAWKAWLEETMNLHLYRLDEIRAALVRIARVLEENLGSHE